LPNDFLYFLADKDGKIYYAKTYDEHQRNIQLHL
jgi:cell division protein YceG involved in septum cleavage